MKKKNKETRVVRDHVYGVERGRRDQFRPSILLISSDVIVAGDPAGALEHLRKG